MKRPTSNKKPKTLDLPADVNLQQTMQSFINSQIIYQHQKKCQKQGNYVEAQMAKRKVKQLKDQYDKRMKDQIKNKHNSQKQEIEKAHIDQFELFNSEWDEIMQKFEQQITRSQNQMKNRHKQQLIQYQQQLQKSIPNRPKQSPQLINLRKIEQNLAKQQNYLEAHKVQQRANQIQKHDSQKYFINRNQKIKNLLNQLKNKQEYELNALRQKIILGIEQKKKIRENDLQKLMQKYQNVKKQLDYQQNQQLSRYDKSIKNQCQAYIISHCKFFTFDKFKNVNFIETMN